jgi:iduronate 2-sulfatase
MLPVNSLANYLLHDMNVLRCALTFIVAAAVFVSQTAAKPNVLLICVDDLKPLLGCYGDNVVQSPNIDRLAKRGLRFTAAYCNQAVCAPSRNALLTGLRPQSLGIYDLNTFFRNAQPAAVTLPQHFMANGYRTEGLGKIFHVGHGNHDDAASWRIPHWSPKTRLYQLPENRPRKRKSGAKGNAFEQAEAADSAYADGQIADEAVRRLHQAAEKPDEPFLLAVGFNKPHLPFCAPRKYWDLYEPDSFELPKLRRPPGDAPKFAPTNWAELRGYRGIPKRGELPEELTRTLIHGYHASISYMDAQLGRVLDALDATGLDDKTIIVIWGDHGWHLGDHGMWCKHSNYEQATRIPLIIVAPGFTTGDSSTAALVESVDIYPTLCSLAGLSIPEKLDGVDFSTLLNATDTQIKDAVFHVYPRGKRLGRAVRTSRYRLVEWKAFASDQDNIVYELYDYETDPAETKNLANERPEIVKQLAEILAGQPQPISPLESIK